MWDEACFFFLLSKLYIDKTTVFTKKELLFLVTNACICSLLMSKSLTPNED